MKKLLFRVVFVLAIPLISPVKAQVLSLDKVVKMGLEQSKSMKLAQANADVAAAKFESVHESYIPTVTLSGVV